MTSIRASLRALSFVALLVALLVQAPVSAHKKGSWVVTYNGPGNGDDAPPAIAIDRRGNVYVTGNSPGAGTDVDIATIKYDPSGKQLWLARYNGPANGGDYPTSLVVDGDGNVYVTGKSWYVGTDSDYVTVKYDSNGKQLWAARYNGPANALDCPWAIVLDSAKNIYITGESPGLSSTDAATIKYDTNGQQLWVQRYDSPGGLRDLIRTLNIDTNGNIYATGSSVGFSYSGGEDYLALKYSPNGDLLWAQRYNGPANSDDRGLGAYIDRSNNLYITGMSQGIGTGYDAATVKYSPDGTLQWVQRYDGSAGHDDMAMDVAVTKGGDVYITGQSADASGAFATSMLVKYNKKGAQVWSATYPGLTDGIQTRQDRRGLALDGDGNIYVGLFVYNAPASADIVTVKYDSKGRLIREQRYNGTANGDDRLHAYSARDLVVDSDGNVYVGGLTHSGPNGYDMVLLKYARRDWKRA